MRLRELLKGCKPISPEVPAAIAEPAQAEPTPGFLIMPTRGDHTVAPPKIVTHMGAMGYLSSNYNHSGARVLELGSRVVTGANYRAHFDKADYVGFDFYEGPNVDVAGDAHRLSTYFNESQRFDLVYSLAVFEHLYMPWVIAQEIAKVMKVGGVAYIETTFAYAAHERPWNFFQFSELGLRVLFNKSLGFEILDMGMSNPMMGFFSDDCDEYLQRRPIPELYCHSSILCRKDREAVNFDWTQVQADDVVDGDRYPAPQKS
ncbi:MULTISPECIES: class I SAM-dependent methyltransferase [unclassified Mesorhizobium]|uniref:methyltransferase domain-containing protein n=1 Tax=unclassified Mesorhizobium TaxID=325217 RepID=UPI0012DED0A9|nr:class I SAM-dependent methyltransferase [Mesorhizobium sp. L103C565B0]